MSKFSKFFEVLEILKCKKILIYLTIFNLIYTILEVASLGMLIPLLNIVLKPDVFLKNLTNSENYFFEIIGNYLVNYEYFTIVKILCFVFFILMFIKLIYSLFFEWYKANQIYLIEYKLTELLFKKYITSDYKYILDRNSSEFHRYILGDIGLFNGTVQSLNIFFTDIIFTIGIFFLLLYVNTSLTISLVILLGILGYVIFKFTSKLSFLYGKELSDNTEKKINIMLQSFGGVKEIIIYNSSEFFSKIFNKINKKLFNAKRKNAVLISLPKLTIEFIIFLVFLILILILIYINKDLSDLIVELSFLAFAIIRLAPALYRINTSLQRLEYTQVPINNIHSKLNTNENLKFIEKLNISKYNFKKIEFKKVNFQFNQNKIFENGNILIESNTTIGIYGDSGSGKSTFVNLLAGLYFPNKGEIVVDGNNIQENIVNWRQCVGYVPQNVFILDDTIEKNIAFGLDEDKINNQKLMSSIKMSGLEEFYQKFKSSNNKSLGENGSRLSGGQKQRIGIARALYKESELLIFDEATNALDEKIEDEIIRNVYSLKKDFTIIIISHDKRIIEKCDSIYQIKNLLFNKEK